MPTTHSKAGFSTEVPTAARSNRRAFSLVGEALIGEPVASSRPKAATG